MGNCVNLRFKARAADTTHIPRAVLCILLRTEQI